MFCAISFNMSKLKKFIFNAAFMTFSSTVLRGAIVWFNIYLSKHLKYVGMGVYSLVMTVYMFAVSVATSGITLAVTRLVSEEVALGNHRGVKEAMKKCFIFALFLSMLSFFGIYFFRQQLSSYVFDNMLSADFVKLMAFCFPCISLSAVINGYFTAVRKSVKSSANQIFEQAVKIASTIVLLEFFSPEDLESCMVYIIFGNIFGEYISLCVIMRMYIKDVRRYTNPKEGKDISKRILKIAVPVALSSYLKSALTAIKQVMIPNAFERGGMVKEDAMSMYGRINAMAMPVVVFPSAFTSSAAMLIIPEVSSCSIKGETRKTIFMVNEILKVTLSFSFGVALMLFLYGEKLGLLFYKSSGVGFYIICLAPIVILMYTDTVVDSVLKGIDCQVSVVKINILDTVLCILFTATVIPGLKGIGYIVMLYLSEAFNVAVSYITLKRKLKFKMDMFKTAVKPLICLGIACFTGGFLCRNNIFGGAVICILYAFLLVCTGTVLPERRAKIQ